MRPGPVSATKTSPLGATRISRGPLKPSANNAILNPMGTCGTADACRVTICEPLETEGVAPGFGKSSGLISLSVPGRSARQSPNAALPVSGDDCATAGVTPPTANAVASQISELLQRSMRSSLSDESDPDRQ